MLSLAGVERVPQDARGAAAAHDLRPRHDRGAEGAADGRRPLPPLRLRAARRSSRSPSSCTRVAAEESIEIAPDAVALLARHATGSFRDALGTLEQLVTYAGTTIATEDVLAVLGVADADLLFGPSTRSPPATPAPPGSPPRAWPTPAATPPSSCKDLEAHARDLLVVQTLGEVPAELRADARSRRAPRRAGRARAGRERRPAAGPAGRGAAPVKDGADARTQLELALVKAAAPEVDPRRRALLARVERLEAALAGGARQRPRRRRRRRPRPPAAPPQRRRTPPPPAAAAHRPSRAAEPAAAPRSRSPERDRSRRGRRSRRRRRSTSVLHQLWPAVLDAVRVDNALLAACLAEARPVEVRGREVVVAFAEHDSLQPQRMADGREHRAARRRGAARPGRAARCASSSSCATLERGRRRAPSRPRRGRARRPLQDGVRRRGDRPRRSATRRAGGPA